LAPLELDVLTAPDPHEAEAAGSLAQQEGAQDAESPFAHCFSCGFARCDDLRIVPGPVGFAWMHRLAAGTAIITARMTAVVDRSLQVGQKYTVIGWPIAQEGRKLHAGTAIFDAAGKVQARSRQLWLIRRA
jgi:hypothetical protein